MARPTIERFAVVALAMILQSLSINGDEPARHEIYARTVSGCAWVLAGNQGVGSGCLVDVSRRWLVTSYHVVGDAKTVDVVFPTWNDGKLEADRAEIWANARQIRVVGKAIRRQPDRDLALVELDALPSNIRAIPLADRSSIAGDDVFLVGNRRDLDRLWGFTSGVVRQSFRGPEGYAWRTQRLAQGAQFLALQAPINEGDSGGPVVNEFGELVGVAAAILWPADRIALAVDVRDVRVFLGADFVKQPEKSVEVRGHYAKLLRSTVWVQSPSAIGRASGAIIDRDRRLILTTANAVATHERVEVVFPLFDAKQPITDLAAYKNAPRIRAVVLQRDERRNLAVLEAESMPTAAAASPFAARPAQPGDELHAISNPNGIESLWLYSRVMVRQTGRTSFSTTKDEGQAAALILQAPGQANDSGGAIANANGEIVAIAGGKDGPEQQVSYAVDLSEIKEFLASARPIIDPKTADEFHRRGKGRMRVRRLAAALADFHVALRLEPQHIPTWVDLPLLYRLRGEPEKAVAAIRSALQTLPPDRCALPLACQAGLFVDVGKWDEAVKQCDLALKVDPKCASALAYRAEARLGQKDFERATADADEAVWLEPNLAAGYVARARIQFRHRKFDQAISNLSRAIELEPFDVNLLLERAAAFDELLDKEKAKRDRAAAERLK